MKKILFLFLSLLAISPTLNIDATREGCRSDLQKEKKRLKKMKRQREQARQEAAIQEAERIRIIRIEEENRRHEEQARRLAQRPTMAMILAKQAEVQKVHLTQFAHDVAEEAFNEFEEKAEIEEKAQTTTSTCSAAPAAHPAHAASPTVDRELMAINGEQEAASSPSSLDTTVAASTKKPSATPASMLRRIESSPTMRRSSSKLLTQLQAEEILTSLRQQLSPAAFEIARLTIIAKIDPRTTPPLVVDHSGDFAQEELDEAREEFDLDYLASAAPAKNQEAAEDEN